VGGEGVASAALQQQQQQVNGVTLVMCVISVPGTDHKHNDDHRLVLVLVLVVHL